MDQHSHFNFFIRCLLLLVLLLCRQLPFFYNVHVDTAAFLEVFSADINGEKVKPSPWELRPDGAVHQTPDSNSARENARREYLEELRPYMANGTLSFPAKGIRDKTKSRKIGVFLDHYFTSIRHSDISLEGVRKEFIVRGLNHRAFPNKPSMDYSLCIVIC